MQTESRGSFSFLLILINCNIHIEALACCHGDQAGGGSCHLLPVARSGLSYVTGKTRLRGRWPRPLPHSSAAAQQNGGSFGKCPGEQSGHRYGHRLAEEPGGECAAARSRTGDSLKTRVTFISRDLRDDIARKSV